MNYNFSDKIKALKPSAIREILKATSQGDVIPFAAGNPAPDAFPVEDIKKIVNEIFEKDILEISLNSKIRYNPLYKPNLNPLILANRLKTILLLSKSKILST